MMSKIHTAALTGLEAKKVTVETDLLAGLPCVILVGLPDTTVRESRDRIKPAVINSGFGFPMKKITVNMSPANTKKEGSHFDLPIAMGILAAAGMVKLSEYEKYAFIGELSLDGELRRIEGALPLTMGLKESGAEKIFLPYDNAQEAGLVRNVKLYPAKSLKEIAEHLKAEEEGIEEGKIKEFSGREKEVHNIGSFCIDYSDVLGQERVKRAVTICCAGNHGLLLRGEPGSGKSMIAKRIPTVLPELTYDECLEVTKIYSVAGKLSDEVPLIRERPFRAPHHTVSETALIGGGGRPKPGEISLAHKGVLFLDEIPEFGRGVLETLRQPLEDKKVLVTRNAGSYVFPCDTMLVAAANPCPCGYYGSEKHSCTCSGAKLERYRSKLSGPLLDRFDLQVDVRPVRYEELSGNEKSVSSSDMKKQVERVRKIQKIRYKGEGIDFNSQLDTKLMNKYCHLDTECRKLLESAFERLGLSARGYSRVVKTARTIADLEESADIKAEHIAEALGYRKS